MTEPGAVLQLVDATHQATAGWYADYVDPSDLYQELALYAITNTAKFQKWIDVNEEHRVTLALKSAARIYGATEKAKALGYEYEDVAWYSPEGLVAIVPVALDTEWDGLTGEVGDAGMPVAARPANEGGTLLATVMDVRRVLSTGRWLVSDFDPETERGLDNLLWLSERLGGQRPHAPGFAGRRSMSNGMAQKITRENG